MDDVRIVTDYDGTRHMVRGITTHATDTIGCWARIAKAVAALPVPCSTLAWIGGGFCLGPRIANGRGARQDVYEIRPEMETFCPDYANFIVGDWHATLAGKYDAIIYHIIDNLLPEDDRPLLEAHLNPGGLLIVAT